MDVREGGSWNATMFGGPERKEIHWAGEFVELAEPERLVLTMTDSPGEPERAVITVELADLGDGRTEMTMEQRSPLPPDQVEGARSGWGSFFDRMGERLAEARDAESATAVRPGPGATSASRAPISSPHRSQVRCTCGSPPQSRWRSSMGGPSSAM